MKIKHFFLFRTRSFGHNRWGKRRKKKNIDGPFRQILFPSDINLSHITRHSFSVDQRLSPIPFCCYFYVLLLKMNDDVDDGVVRGHCGYCAMWWWEVISNTEMASEKEVKLKIFWGPLSIHGMIFTQFDCN